MTRQKEGLLDDKIREYCKQNNIFYMKTNGDGLPDCIMCCKGKFVAFETKVDKNKLSELQKFFINKIEKNKGVALEIRTFEDAKKIIDLYKEGGML